MPLNYRKLAKRIFRSYREQEGAVVKKKTLIMFIILLIATFVPSLKSIADFGDFSGGSDYDYSYDYDSHDYSSSDYGNDSDYDRRSSGSGAWDLKTIIIICAIVAVIFLSVGKKEDKGSKASGNANERAESRANRAELTPIGEYVKIDPNFSAAVLCERASNLYVQMQNGWTAKDIESMRPYFTDVLFTQMERSLKLLIKNGETNHVERIAVLDVTPRGFHQTSGEDHIMLRLRTRITDYTVKDKTGEVVRGSRDNEKFMTYEWDLMRPTGIFTGKDGSTAIKHISCPGCGAPLDINASARCPYCNSVIQQQAQDWVISAIKGIKQETKKAGK